MGPSVGLAVRNGEPAGKVKSVVVAVHPGSTVWLNNAVPDAVGKATAVVPPDVVIHLNSSLLLKVIELDAADALIAAAATPAPRGMLPIIQLVNDTVLGFALASTKTYLVASVPILLMVH